MECSTCAAFLGTIVRDLGSAIDNGTARWAKPGWAKDPAALATSSGRKRRADYHVKQFVVHESLVASTNASSSAHVAARSLGADTATSLVHAWRKQEVAHIQSASRLSFARCMNLSTSWDGFRAGQPAVEIIGCVAENLDSQAVTVVAPQVTGYPC